MKKYFFLSLLSIVCSCSMYEHDTAPAIARHSHSSSDSMIETRSSKTFDELPENYDFRVKFSEAELVARKCSSGKTLQEIIPFSFEGDTLFYIANYDKGYKVISGDKRTSLFLLESDEGRFEFEMNGEFDGPSFWLNDLASEILLLKKGKAKVKDVSNVLFWSAVTGDEEFILQQDLMMRGDLDSIDFDDPDHVWALVPISDNTYYYNEFTTPHLLSTKWGQDSPWNTYVPFSGTNPGEHCPTGCTAVAMSQIIYYCHYNLYKPNWLYHGAQVSGTAYGGAYDDLTYISGTYVPNSTHWDDMAVDTSSYLSGDNADYVSQLMVDVGHQVGMIYSPDGSGAPVTKSGFNHYEIYCDSCYYNTSTVMSCLLSHKPVVVRASINEGLMEFFFPSGHAWVIDGLVSAVTEHVQTYEWRRLSELTSNNYILYTDEQMMMIDPDVYSGKPVQEITRSNQYYYLMNWGYDGRYDNVFYGVNDNIWTYVNENNVSLNFQYNKLIWYDFR